MKRYLIFSLLALAVWGCSSDSDSTSSSQSTFAAAAEPAWAIDWSSNETAPNWQEPTSESFECSMDMLVTLNDDLQPYASAADMMAVFMHGECRAVSYPNVMKDGKVAYLLHIKGSSEEVGNRMLLYFYCDKQHTMNQSESVPPFTPNNLMDEAYHLNLSFEDGSTKYPYFTVLNVMMPESLPFTVNERDKMAVFVGDECRGIGISSPNGYDGWRMNVYSRQPNETAQIRYYSADKGGVYTILKNVTLNNDIQVEHITF